VPEIVRVLIPDHPDLAGQLARALEFGAVLRHANEPDTEAGSEPWRLPDQLVAPELEEALDAAVLHDWHFHVGNDAAGTDTAIAVSHANFGHMGLYITSATTTQLTLLAAALDLLIRAENTPPSQQLPAQREIAQFIEVSRDADKSGEDDASLSAWETVVRVLALAAAAAPTTTNRPPSLYTVEASLLPVPDADGTSPAADTRLVLDRIDAGNGRSAELDDAAFRAWRRLTAEWHTAIYGARANTPDSLLMSYAY
jgi:hypothetical protein